MPGQGTRTDSPHLSPLRYLLVWLSIGVQSFGGGTVTLSLIRRAAVDRYGWVTADEFTRDWALVLLAPGINLIGLTILIGRRAAGAWGIVGGCAGLLLPSSLITVALTAAYARYAATPIALACLRAVVPAVVGIGAVTAWRMAYPLVFAPGRTALSRTLDLFLLTGAAAAYAVWPHVPAAALLLGGAAIAAASALFTRRTQMLLPAQSGEDK